MKITLRKFLVANLAIYLALMSVKSEMRTFAAEMDVVPPSYSSEINHYQRGVEYYQVQEYSKAIDEFKFAIKLNNSDDSSRINLAASLIARGSYFNNQKNNVLAAASDFREAIFYLKYDEGAQDYLAQQENYKIAKSNLELTLKQQKIGLDSKSRMKLADRLRGQGKLMDAAVEYNEALGDKGSSVEAFEALGDIMKVLQKPHKAIEYYSKALAVNPNSGKLHWKLAIVLSKVGNLDGAGKEFIIAISMGEDEKEIIPILEGMWKERIAQANNDPVAHMNLGVVYQKKVDYNAALAEYEISQKIDPSNQTLRLNMGTLFQAKGDIDTAIKAYDSILEVGPTNSLAHYYRATALREKVNLTGAMQEFQIALKLDPKNVLIRKELFNTAKKAKTPEESQLLFRKILENNPQDPLIVYNYAYEMHLAKKYDEALDGYLRVITLEPKMTDAYLNAASIYKEKGLYVDAITILNNALAMNPDNKKVKELLSQVKEETTEKNYQTALEKHNKGDYQGAVDEYLAMIKAGNINSDTYLNLGSAYQAMDKLDEAIVAYNKSLELDSKNSSAMYYLGTAYYTRKNPTKAMELYKKAFALEPDNQEIRQAIDTIKAERQEQTFDKGLKEYEAAKYSLALTTFNSAIAQDAKSAYAYYYRGMTYDGLKKYVLAVADYKKAIELDKNLKEAYFSLAVDYDTLKNKPFAKTYYQKYLLAEKDQSIEYVKYSKDRLKQLK